jgi:arylsulfatase A-like enzyme
VGDFYQDSLTVNASAFDFLERHRNARFYLFLHYMDPHYPYFRHPYDGHAIARVSNQHPDPSLAEEMHRLYKGEIEYLDRNFQALLHKLRELELYDDTVIALVADHGEEFYEHGGWWHGLTLYEEQIHVPLIIKWSKHGRPQAENLRGRVARLIDVAPTLIANAGANAPPAMQGLDLADGLAQRSEKDQMAFSEEDHEGNVLRSIRTTEWKLIEANEGNPRGLAVSELYEISRDPAEAKNVIAEHIDVGGELRAHADAQETAARAAARTSGESRKLSDAEEEALRSLGYIE